LYLVASQGSFYFEHFETNIHKSNPRPKAVLEEAVLFAFDAWPDVGKVLYLG